MATPRHYTSHDMLDAAFMFREAELWSELEDSDIFAVALPSDETGYCITMGATGTYYGLGMYRGSKGFSTYLRMINPPQNQIDAMAERLTYEVINCNFSQANEMNFGLKEPVREFSKKFKTPIPKKKGWPEFVQYKPFRVPSPVSDEQDGDDIATALRAGAHLAKLLETHTIEELGFDPDGEYPTKKGGKTVPLLIGEGSADFRLETTTLPAYEEFEYPRPNALPKEVADKVRALPKNGCIEIGAMSLPGLMRDAPDNMALTTLPYIHTESGRLSVVTCEHPYDLAPDDLLRLAIDSITRGGIAPDTIICTDELTASLLKDCCQATGISMKRAKKSSQLTYASLQLYSSMMRGI